MIRKVVLGMGVAAACLTLGLATVSADDLEGGAAEGVTVTVTGENYNLLATLTPDAAGDAAEGVGGMNALKVTEVTDAEGNAVEGWVGKTLHYLPTKSAADLMMGEGNQGKTVTVTGKVFQDAATLHVETFTLASSGGNDLFDEWDEIPVGTMTKQQVL